MVLRISPGSRLAGSVDVPGDKSIAHRWLILAATARGTSRLGGLPDALDVRSTARALAAMAPSTRPELEGWVDAVEGTGGGQGQVDPGVTEPLTLTGAGRAALRPPVLDLDCGNSGTTMRLLAGLAASIHGRTVLIGDESLSRRPMERVAGPLRLMGARVRVRDGRPPLEIEGGSLSGVRYACPVPSAQVKGAVLLAGLAAEGETVVEEPAPTRDHTERALAALGAPVRQATLAGGRNEVGLRAFQHGGFEGTVPGDPSSAAYLLVAAALLGSELAVRKVGLNPTRTRFLEVLARMGVAVDLRTEQPSLDEPVGELSVEASARGDLEGTAVPSEELPLVIDEVPVLAAAAAHARSETRFAGAGELREKESDRLAGLADGLRALGGEAAVEGDGLVVAGGGLAGGGSADAAGDHRLAMALTVAALAARGPCEVRGIGFADVSFPGFVPTLQRLGARVEVTG